MKPEMTEIPWVNVRDRLPEYGNADDAFYAVLVYIGDTEFGFWHPETRTFRQFRNTDRDITELVQAWAPYPSKPGWL